jgi:hypothetical protein
MRIEIVSGILICFTPHTSGSAPWKYVSKDCPTIESIACFFSTFLPHSIIPIQAQYPGQITPNISGLERISIDEENSPPGFSFSILSITNGIYQDIR